MGKYCPTCGTILDQKEGYDPKFCANCGLKLNSKVDFCPKCGVRTIESLDVPRTLLKSAWWVISTVSPFILLFSIIYSYYFM
jgi:predicted amidophosphoribosyltransferase